LRASALASAYGEIAAHEQRSHEGDAADVDVAILAAESQTFREVGPDLVAVEHFDAATAGAQLGRQPLGNRAFPGA
jgi:hypothetical protein